MEPTSYARLYWKEVLEPKLRRMLDEMEREEKEKAVRQHEQSIADDIRTLVDRLNTVMAAARDSGMSVLIKESERYGDVVFPLRVESIKKVFSF